MIRHRALPAALLVAVLLVWAPLPFASVTPTWSALLQGGCFLALALSAFALRRPGDLRPVAVPAAALLVVGLVGVLQSLPWPQALVAGISPGHGDLFAGAGALVGPEKVTPTLSLSPWTSRSTALAWAAAAAILAAAAVAGRRRRHRRLVLAALAVSALVQVLYGTRLWTAGAKSLWGVVLPGDASRLRGTFVNPNHLATFLEIALAATFALAWWSLRRVRYEHRPEARLVLWVAPGLLWLTLFAGLTFTGSRAGMAAAVAGALVQGALAARLGRSFRPLVLGAGLAAVGLGAVLVIGAWEAFGRFMTHSAFDVALGARAQVYGASVELWRRFPWLGTGLGTFGDAFPLVQPPELDGTWRHAHSDPVELLVTVGVLGLVPVVVGLGALVLRLRRVLLKGERSEDRAAALAALGALTAVLAHELVDFGLAIPANATTLAAVCGVAAGVPISRPGGRGSLLPGPRSPAPASPPPGGGSRQRPRPGGG